MLTTDRHAAATSEKRKHFLSGNAIAGVIGGFTSSLIMHPLDVVTTRMQAQDGRISSIPKYRNPFLALVIIARTEGFKRLYAGLVPNLVGSTTNWGIYFFGYNYSRSMMRAFVQDAEGGAEEKELGPVLNLCCATATGFVSAIATQPIWLAKTRMELQQGSGPNFEYRGMLHCITTVAHKEGTSSLFRGLLPSLLLVSHIALHFMAYEEFKLMLQRASHKEHLTPEQTCLAASCAKFFATVATYPTQVVRTRLQLQQVEVEVVDPAGGRPGAGAGAAPAARPGAAPRPYYKGMGDVFHKIVQYEGVRGLYKGLGTNFLRVIPTTAITFVVYESVAKHLGART